MNALGFLEAEAATFFYVSSAGLADVPRSLYEEYPPSFRPPPSASGVFRLPWYVPAASDAAFSALRVHPFLLANRLREATEDERRERLAKPPLAAHPDAVPVLPPPSPSTRCDASREPSRGSVPWPHSS